MAVLKDILEYIINIPWTDYTVLAVQSINDYNSKNLLVVLVVYSIFSFITIMVLVLYLLCKEISVIVIGVFRKQRKEMLLSNQMLFLINFD